jgi:hypothetical protein
VFIRLNLISWEKELSATMIDLRTAPHRAIAGKNMVEVLLDGKVVTLAADLRKLTKRRKQTPSEVLLREGRDER